MSSLTSPFIATTPANPYNTVEFCPASAELAHMYVHTGIWLVLERKTCGRQLHLQTHLFWFVLYPFCNWRRPFRGRNVCQVKLSTTCLTLKNQQIPIYRRGNESLLYHHTYIRTYNCTTAVSDCPCGCIYWQFSSVLYCFMVPGIVATG